MAAAFRTRYSDDALIDAVRDVSAHVAPGQPTQVAPAAFDAARVHAGHPHAPAAKQITRRLGSGWYELLAIAHAGGGASAAHRLGLARRDPPRELGIDEVVVALRLIAARAGLAGLWPARYAAERDALIAHQRRAHRHSPPSMQALPTVAQIEIQFGWDAACRAAGLAEPDTSAGRIRGLTQLEVTDRFIDDLGCLPWSIAAIENYARARDIPTVNLKAVAPYAAEVTVLRAAAGKWTPARPPAHVERPDETAVHDAHASPPPAAATLRRMRSWEDLDDIIAGVADAYRQAGARSLTQRLHRELAAASRGAIPSPSVVDRAAKRHGTTASGIRRTARNQVRS
ncbi:hypothetical protein [Candidatus Solirubrobacter pratensis]|uniref:hypothetical protein n=1 Tax=Candidatus Solirubrobacter pratensis TaxID=1298857 RepID=UPI000484B9D6|nr:hypothetical protein [Candidatus Solirubrobacter pratensis]